MKIYTFFINSVTKMRPSALLHCICRDGLKPLYSLRKSGTQIKLTKLLTKEAVEEFTRMSGDTDAKHAQLYPLEKTFVSPAHLNCLFAGLIATRLPGRGAVLRSQEWTVFSKCQTGVPIDFEVRLVMEDKHCIRIAYDCIQNEYLVMEGTAKLVHQIPLELHLALNVEAEFGNTREEWNELNETTHK